MTVINHSAADGFIERLPKDMRFFLVHGSDEGLAHERVKTIVRRALGGDLDPLRLVRLEGDAVARDPGRLADEAYAVAMFGGARAIWIDAQTRDLAPALEPLFANPPRGCVIVVKAGQLRRGAALRSAFEARPLAAAIECYPDEARSLGLLLEAEAKAAGLAIAPDARGALLALLGADRQTTRTELQKLMLYARGRGRIEVEDIEAIVSDAAPSVLDELINLTLLGDLTAVAAAAVRYFSEGGGGDALLVRLVSRLTLLHRLRVEMDQGKPFDAACQALSLRLPPSARRALAHQADRWTSESVVRRLPALRATSAQVRADPDLADALATRALWSLARRRG